MTENTQARSREFRILTSGRQYAVLGACGGRYDAKSVCPHGGCFGDVPARNGLSFGHSLSGESDDRVHGAYRKNLRGFARIPELVDVSHVSYCHQAHGSFVVTAVEGDRQRAAWSILGSPNEANGDDVDQLLRIAEVNEVGTGRHERNSQRAKKLKTRRGTVNTQSVLRTRERTGKTVAMAVSSTVKERL